MKKFNKIICSLILVFILLVTYSVNATTIKETTNPDDNYGTIADGTFVIGITKFEPDVIITALRATTATYNDVMFNYGKPGYEGVDIYYYVAGYWFKFDEQNNVTEVASTDPMYEKLNNSNIYYVNNVEKIIDIEFNREISEGSEFVFETNNHKTVTYENGVLHVPATVDEVYVYEKNASDVKTLITILTRETENEETYIPTEIVYLTASQIEAKTNTLINTYYNKYSNGDLLTDVNDSVFYVDLGEYKGSNNPQELVIGNDTYAANQAYKLSIGNNAFTNVPVWKIVDGKLLVALTWISVDSVSTPYSIITVGGQTFAINVYDANTSNGTLSVTNVSGVFDPAGYTSTATFAGNTVDYTYTHGTQAVGVTLSSGTEAITADNQVILLKASDNSMAITTTELGHTFVLYFHYDEAPIIQDTEYQRSYTIAVPGKGVTSLTLNGHAKVQGIDLSGVVETQTNSFISTYYNQYNDGDLLTEVNDNIFYINLGEYRGTENPESLTIAGEIYNAESANVGESQRLSIGNNAFTNVPVWKIADGNVLVALPWLSADAMPNQATEIVVGGQTFKVNVYGTDTSDNTLNVTSVGSLFSPLGFTADAIADGNRVDFYYTHGAQALGVKLSLNNEEITAANQVVMLKGTNRTMAITTTEYGYTFTLYFRYMNAAIEEPAEYERIYKIAIPGKGVTNLELYGHAISQSVDLSETVATQSAALLETYYNQYNSGDILTEVNDDIFYINLGRYLGSANPSSLTIGNETYNVSGTANVGESFTMDIGNNAVTNVPVWKIVNDDVLVALSWLTTDAMPSQATTVTIGGQTFRINVYGSTTVDNSLTLTGTGSLYGPTGYGYNIETSRNTVDYTYTHGAQALGVTLSHNNEALTSSELIVFCKEVNGNMKLATAEEGYTLLVHFNYMDEPVTTAANYLKSYKVAIPAKGVTSLTLNGHAVSQIVNLQNTMETRMNTLINTYYNQYNNGDLITSVNDDVFYVNLGKYLGTSNPTSLVIGNETYDGENNVGQTLKMSIGHNAFTNVPVWKIVNGNVLVALSWLSADAMPNQETTVTIGGQIFRVNVYGTDTVNNTLSLTNAGALFGPSGYETDVVMSRNTVDFYYTHGTQALGVTISYGDEAITAANQVILMKSTNGNMAITTTEYGYTFTIYFGYMEAPITEAADYQRFYKVAIPGKGVISLALNGHAVTEISH